METLSYVGCLLLFVTKLTIKDIKVKSSEEY